MITIASLRDKHAGRPGAVLGGGPSLQADLAQVPPGAVLISVNQHAVQHVWTNYLVFLDEPGRYPAMLDLINTYQGAKVSPLREWSDVDLDGADYWRGNFSSHLACWLACWLGCDPVLLCGMDCYQGPRPPDADPRDNAYNTPLAEHLEGWRLALERCPNAGVIRAVSGPLVEIFGAFP